MWEQAMSTTKVKRNWSILSRSTFTQTQAPTSPAPDTEPAASSQTVTANAQQKKSSAAQDTALLQTVRNVLLEYEQLDIKRPPLSDPKVVAIRKEVEKAMPRLYAMIEEHSNHTSLEARRIKSFAEDFLRKFPDINVDALRATFTSESAAKPPLSPSAASQSGTPPKSRGTSVSPKPEVSANRPPRIESDAGLDRETRLAPVHLRDAIAVITPSQKLVFLAVHDLLSATAGVVKNVSHSWFNPPAARSPDELQVAHTPILDRRSFAPTHAMHVPSSLPPSLPAHNIPRYPPVSPYEHSSGTRSHRRSASNDSSL